MSDPDERYKLQYAYTSGNVSIDSFISEPVQSDFPLQRLSQRPWPRDLLQLEEWSRGRLQRSLDALRTRPHAARGMLGEYNDGKSLFKVCLSM